MELRWYQEEAVNELIKTNCAHPVVVAPTGSGKTLILCGFIDKCLTKNPKHNVLVLSHVEDILRQDFKAIEKYFGEDSCGLYSAGLSSRTIKKLTVAGIQSVYRKPEYFSQFTIIIIDECHLINHKREGMYRKFLESFDNAQYIGLTATPWRLSHGRICDGEEALFTDIIYDLSS